MSNSKEPLNPFTMEWMETKMPSVTSALSVMKAGETVTVIDSVEGYRIEISGTKYRYVKV